MTNLGYNEILTQEVLYEMYIKQGLSSNKISKYFNINKNSVLSRLNIYGFIKEMQLEQYFYSDVKKD